ncbi:helix-turn-helix domain-containing protein [Paenibacillus sp. NPDC057886]|uniref:helix-turn-helix domain-containing protein n=1 Tax=Paenibacillus sp. NPDC057886 TaxID=3346270 RepID=UPI0036B6BB9F
MTTLRNSVGERIRAIRKAKSLTQQQLAELSGLDDAYIGSLERGERNFSIDTLEKIVEALKIEPQNLFFIEDHDEQQKAVHEYIAIISDLKNGELTILKNVIREVSKAFHSS